MRISTINITNFKAIRHAELTQLDAQPFTVLTGRNGTGKSAVFQALYLLARVNAPEPQPDLVRLGEEEAEIDVAFSLTDTEFQQVDQYHWSIYGKPAEPNERHRRVAKIDKAGNVTYSGSPVAATIFDPRFRRRRNFPGIALVHAERGQLPGLGIGDAGGLKLGGQFGSFDPADYLTSCLKDLDYRSLLEIRRGGVPRDDYGDLARVFFEATSKRLLRPRAEGFEGTRIEVELRAGQRHGLSGLSSGESGLLGLLCSLYQSAADGGVLLLDEPELHLHTVLQTALMRTVRELAARMQTIMVTHAVKIVASTPPSQVYQIRHSSPDQARRGADASSLVGVVSDMGIKQADLLGKACHLVVEGETDESRLLRLFPDEMEHVHVTQAGDCKQVLAYYRHLTDGPMSLPWLCLIDRDLMSEADIEQRQQTHPDLYIWPRRALESMLLDSALLSAVTNAVGRSISPDEAEARLRDAADHLMDEVVTAMLHATLERAFPQPRRDGSRGDVGVQEFYASSARAMQARGNAVTVIRARLEAEVKDRWEHDRFVLVDPKKVLGRLTAHRSPFRTTHDLMNALITRAAQDPDVRPAGLEDFRLRLVRLIASEH